MSDYIAKRRRRNSKKSKSLNGCKMAAALRAYTIPKQRTSFRYPNISNVTLSDDGGTVYITQKMIVGGKKIGCISHKGRLYNVVIVPNPNPDTTIDDDKIIKPKSKKEGEIL